MDVIGLERRGEGGGGGDTWLSREKREREREGKEEKVMERKICENTLEKTRIIRIELDVSIRR